MDLPDAARWRCWGCVRSHTSLHRRESFAGESREIPIESFRYIRDLFVAFGDSQSPANATWPTKSENREKDQQRLIARRRTSAVKLKTSSHCWGFAHSRDVMRFRFNLRLNTPPTNSISSLEDVDRREQLNWKHTKNRNWKMRFRQIICQWHWERCFHSATRRKLFFFHSVFVSIRSIRKDFNCTKLMRCSAEFQSNRLAPPLRDLQSN